MKKLFLLLILQLPLISLANEVWMRYPSISPDGKHIVFSYQGDLFLVETKGGEAKQLTSHSAHDFMPVWSSDSKTIAFASNRHGNFDVFVVAKEGGVPTRLTFHSSNDYPYDFKQGDKEVVYMSGRLDTRSSVQFPYPMLGEVYSVSVTGGREKMEMTVAAEAFQYSKDGNLMIFQDVKGYEDPWRKHQESSVARDIILYDTQKKSFKQLTDWKGEDRNPLFIDNNTYYFLSEKSGNFNIWKGSVNGGAYGQQITDLKTHPVRFLSMADNGTLCFGYHGEVYVLENGQPKKVEITVHKDVAANETVLLPIGGNASEFAVSADGKEVVFVHRGDVFAASVEYGTTKQITFTSGQERNVSFSPDGKKILFAGERENSWNIYEVKRKNEAEKFFYNATLLEETALVTDAEESFDPKYAPNGEEVAFLENRTTLKVINLKTKAIREVLAGTYNYSYSDGDQYYTWSPDSKYLLVQFFEFGRWNTDIGLVAASGKEKPLNLTQSGYGSSIPKFTMDGQMIYFFTDKYGLRSHGSWGSQADVEAVFLNRDAYYRFTLNEEDYKAWKEAEEEAQKKKDEEKEDDKKKDASKDKEEKPAVKDIVVEKEGLYDRRVRLTTHSSMLGDVLINKEGTEMFYQSNFEKGYDIWTTKFKTRETKLLMKAGSNPSPMYFDAEEKSIFYNSNGTITKLDIATAAPKPVSAGGEMVLNGAGERAYMFEHAWRQVREKFYVENLHGVDWDLYKKEYEPKLSTITNGMDFAEMLSELLGELNASHTGARYRKFNPDGDQTAVLACYYDDSYKGDGLMIAEIMDKSPLTLHSKKIKNGTVIEKIDGNLIAKDQNYYSLFNRKAGKKVLLSCYDPKTKERWDEVVVPISFWEENYLSYERWIKHNEHMVDSLSGGRLGYVHIEGMDSESFRKLFDKALGKYNQKEALIVDTRFNGGGWLHDDLATFLSGKMYMSFEPRGQKNMGGEPIWKWQKPSCVLMSEGNYSDAHLFPYTYKALGIGPLIGMPVPGTGTAVWWETMVDGATTFGIPQIGMRSVTEGYLVENHELQPDIKVKNEYDQFTKGVDQQLVRAVEEMLKKK
jgi:Tol biopolymer transport system component/C-terminal processing protease CtpA/Prc